MTKTWLLRGGALAAALAALGFLVMVSGVIPLRASSGHWAITEWVLSFTMRRSVATHSLGIDAPADLRAPGLVLRGAGHYESACRFCHGAPGARMPVVPAAMTPHPPPLQQTARELDAEELFYVVKHGVKLTGMPAWPAQQRSDEVWPVVAFLLELRDMDAAQYRSLTRPAAPAGDGVPDVVRTACIRCHGADGQGRLEGAFPRLAGQREAYLGASLAGYARGDRESGIMEPIAARLTPEERREAARYYAALPPMRATAGASSELGARIARDGIPEQKLPACRGCHGPAAAARRDVYPRLAGQQAWYLRDQLALFRAGERGGGTRYAPLMREVASHELSDAQIRAVADHFASLGGDEGP